MTQTKINDITLHYNIEGTGDPLLLLHGLGSSGQDWSSQVEFFKAHYQVITPDVRGHGRTDKPRQRYTIPQFANDIEQLLQHLQIAPVHVVGLSMGGMIAFQMAVDHPELFRSMTIVNSAPALVPKGWAEWWQVRKRQLITRLLGMRKIGEFIAPRLFVGEENAGKKEQFIEQWAQNDKEAYISSFNALINWSVQDRIHTIQTPTLIIASDNDYTPVAQKEAYLKLMPNASLAVMKNAHHAVPVEHPARFNTLLEKFLKEN